LKWTPGVSRTCRRTRVLVSGMVFGVTYRIGT
jgi:hypothetical protein